MTAPAMRVRTSPWHMDCPVLAGAVLHHHQLVAYTAADPGIRPAADTAGLIVLGVVINPGTLDNTSGATGDLRVIVDTVSAWDLDILAGSALAATDFMGAVVVSDDATIALAGEVTNDIHAGYFLGLVGSKARIWVPGWPLGA